MRAFSQYIYIYTYTSIYYNECENKTRGREKEENKEKKRKTSVNGNVGDFRDFIYAYTQIIPRVFPASERYYREGSVGRGRKYTTDPNYTYTCLTHIHIDQSKQGPRDYV